MRRREADGISADVPWRASSRADASSRYTSLRTIGSTGAITIRKPLSTESVRRSADIVRRGTHARFGAGILRVSVQADISEQPRWKQVIDRWGQATVQLSRQL